MMMAVFFSRVDSRLLRPVEAARRSAVKDKTQSINQLQGRLVNAQPFICGMTVVWRIEILPARPGTPSHEKIPCACRYPAS
jgi:hypothetical protein